MSSAARKIGILLRKVEYVGECWLWTGELRQGYAYQGGRQAYKIAYELMVGPVPEGLELDHLCRNPACVFPDHLEPVTSEENIRRRVAANTSCRNGHEYTPENTYVRAGTTTRICRICQRQAVQRYRARLQGVTP